jgi:putative transposase
MPHSLTFFYDHVVFSTKYRMPWVTEELSPKLYAYMTSIVQDKKCYMMEINGADDHVHMLINFHGNCAPSAVVGTIKSSSSRFGKELYGIEDFGWQEGYGGFSVSASQVEHVRRYIRNQRERHRTETFEDEMHSEPVESIPPSGAQSSPSEARGAAGGSC